MHLVKRNRIAHSVSGKTECTKYKKVSESRSLDYFFFIKHKCFIKRQFSQHIHVHLKKYLVRWKGSFFNVTPFESETFIDS